MKHFYSKAAATFLLFGAVATTANADSSARKLLHQTYYGDAQGSLGNTVESRKIDYLYDGNNHLIRAVETSITTEHDAAARTWEITHYYKYEYDANGNLIAERPQTYGAFDYGDWGMIESADSIFYEYNDKNQLVTETHTNVIYEYTYDEQGRRITCSKWNVNPYFNTKKNDLIETYSDFNSFGEPCTITATSPTGKSWNEYTGILTYDERGNKTSEKHINADEGLKFHEEWEYDGDFMTKYINYTVVLDDNGQGMDCGAVTTTYTKQDADGNKVLVTDDSGLSGTMRLDEYTTLTDNNNYSPEVEAEKTGENSVHLTFQVPDGFNMVSPVATIYRNGIKIAEHYAYQTEFDPEWDRILGYYDDVEVRNGNYEYIVLLEEQTADGYLSHNCSDVIPVTYNRYLPVAKDLHVVSTSKSWVTHETTVTIGWTNPEIDSELGFQNICIFTGTAQIAEQTSEDQTTNKMEVVFAQEQTEEDVYVQINYKYGRANSAVFHINLDESSTGIETVTPTASSPTICTISGQRLGNMSQAKGIFIQNGKKYLK